MKEIFPFTKKWYRGAGELSLAGEIRPVTRIRQRVKTALGLGWTKIFAPETEEGVTRVRDVKELIAELNE